MPRVSVRSPFYGRKPKPYGVRAQAARAAWAAAARGPRIPRAIVPRQSQSFQELKCSDWYFVPPAAGARIPHYAGIGTILYNDDAAAWTGFSLANEMSQGAFVDQRIGNRILMTSIHVKFSFFYNPVAAGATSLMRTLVVYDKSPNGVAPLLGDMLGIEVAGVSTSVTFYDGINQGNRDRFQILRDTYTYMDLQHPRAYYDQYIKLNHPAVFAANALNIAAVTTGAIYVLAYASNQDVVSWADIQYRLRYKD